MKCVRNMSGMHPKLTQAIAFLSGRIENLWAIYRFGSFGTDAQRPGSDLDLAFLREQRLSAADLWNIEQDLAAELHLDVDLLDLRAQSTVMRMQVIGTGERIYCANFEPTEIFEDFVYCDYARLNEERRDILKDIYERGSIYGK